MKMIKIYTPAFIVLFIILTLELSAQVGINNSNLRVSGSAMLDINSTDKGLLIPRISTASRDLIPTPATGLLIYNTTTHHFNYYNGSYWYEIEASFVSSVTGTISPGGGVSISADINKLPDNSAMLDLSDPSRGFLPARTSTGSIANPENGLIIYDPTDNLLKYYYENQWFPVCAVSTGIPGATGTQPAIGVSITTNGAGPHHSAILDVVSGSKGILIPRLTTAQRDAIMAVPGLTIFNVSAKTIEFYDGSAWLRMNVILPAGVSISASAGVVCAGTEVTFTASPVNGGTNPVFQWKVNNLNVTGATNIAYTYAPANNDAVTCQMTSSSPCVTGNPALSNQVTMTVNPLLPVSISISPSANPVCAGTTVTFLSDIVNGGTSPAYQWAVNSVNVQGATNPTFSYVPVNNDYVKCIVTSDATCATGTPASSNVVVMNVNPLLPVSISISASGNPVCDGTTVEFTSQIVNGGPSPVYHWNVNGINVAGATLPTFSYVPQNNDVVKCILLSDATCAVNNPAVSEFIQMQVNPLLPVSIVIAPTANPVCAETNVTFTSNIVNGGPNPAFQWLVNGVQAQGATNSSFIYIPLNNDAVICVLTSDATCAINNPANSNPVFMTVHPLLPVSITIAPSENPVCAGTTVNFNSNVVNGGPSPAYQWKVNGADVQGATNPNFSFLPENNDEVICKVTSNAICPIDNPALSNPVAMTVHPLLPVSITIQASANPVCAGTTVDYTSSIVNGGPSPAYQWMVNGADVQGATNPTFSHVPVNNDVVKCILTSDAICPVGNPAISNPVVMTVNPLLPVSITIAPSANPVCAGTSVLYSPNIVNGGTAPAFQWLVNGVDVQGATNPTFSHVPVNNDVVKCILTSNATCAIDNPAISNPVAMTVNPLLPVSITIQETANPVCAGTTVYYTSNIVNGGPSPAYQWTVNGVVIAGATSPSFSYIPLNNDVVKCILTSDATCAIDNPAPSNPVVMTVNPLLPVSITIEPSSNPVCAETSVTYTSSIVNGGPSPVYQWKVNGLDIQGATNPSFTFVPLHSDVVTCVLTSDAICAIGNPATSNPVVMVVHPLLPVSITIAPSANPVCAGTSVTFTSETVNGGLAPAYQWRLNGNNITGATDPTYTSTPVNTDAVSCMLTSNAICPTGNPATSNVVDMTVNPLLPVTVSIGVSANSVCAGTGVVFTATPVNGGTAPQYQWKLNGTNVTGATGSTYSMIPVQGNAVSCVLTSNAVCATGSPATSNTITMTVIPLVPVSVFISSSLYWMMPGTQVTLTAAPPVNGGTAPTYQWKVNGQPITGATNTTYTYTPSNFDKVNCVVTSNSTVACLSNNPATSNTVAMIVYTTGTPCTGVPTVTHGSVTYNTIQIGTQCWFRENLNIGTRINNGVAQTDNGIVEKYCYNDSTMNCDIYGGLYQWNELMQYVTTAGAQGICPTGWHVPTDVDFTTLLTYLGATTVGGKIKEAGTTHWKSPNTAATNETGFTAMPSGYSMINPTGFGSLYRYGYFYTSTQTAPTTAWYYNTIYSAASMNKLLNYKTTGNGVRCLKN